MPKIKRLIRRLPPLLACGSLLLSGCQQIHGDGNTVKESRIVGSFTKLESAGSFDVYISRGNTSSVQIEAEKNLTPYIETRVEDDRLLIKTRDDVWLDPTRDIKVYVTVSDIDEIALAGSGNVFDMDTLLNDQSIRFSVTGSGDIHANLNSPAVTGNVTGSGDLDLAGLTRDIKVSIAGSGNFNGQKLLGENVDANIIGSGNAYVNASTKLTVHIFGSGDVDYKGSPEMDFHIAGSGSVVQK